MDKKAALGFLLRLLVVLVIFGGIYAGLFLLPRYLQARKDRPMKDLAAIHALLSDNFVASEALRDNRGVGATPATSQQLADLRAQVESTHIELDGYLDNPPEHVDADIISALDVISGDQHDIIDAYDARLKVLNKPLVYDPKADLEAFDIRENPDEVAARAENARDALKKFADTEEFPLSKPTSTGEFAVELGTMTLTDDARRSFAASSDCFAVLAKTIRGGRLDEARDRRQTCYRLYGDTRRHTVAALTDPFRSDESLELLKKQRALLDKLLKRLPATQRAPAT
jgi:hypothetical protein